MCWSAGACIFTVCMCPTARLPGPTPLPPSALAVLGLLLWRRRVRSRKQAAAAPQAAAGWVPPGQEQLRPGRLTMQFSSQEDEAAFAAQLGPLGAAMAKQPPAGGEQGKGHGIPAVHVIADGGGSDEGAIEARRAPGSAAGSPGPPADLAAGSCDPGLGAAAGWQAVAAGGAGVPGELPVDAAEVAALARELELQEALLQQELALLQQQEQEAQLAALEEQLAWRLQQEQQLEQGAQQQAQPQEAQQQAPQLEAPQPPQQVPAQSSIRLEQLLAQPLPERSPAALPLAGDNQTPQQPIMPAAAPDQAAAAAEVGVAGAISGGRGSSGSASTSSQGAEEPAAACPAPAHSRPQARSGAPGGGISSTAGLPGSSRAPQRARGTPAVPRSPAGMRGQASPVPWPAPPARPRATPGAAPAAAAGLAPSAGKDAAGGIPAAADSWRNNPAASIAAASEQEEAPALHRLRRMSSVLRSRRRKSSSSST